jgi:hypothetical protein
VDDDAKDHLLDSVGALETRALDGHARDVGPELGGGTSRRLRPKAPMAARAAEAITTSVTTCLLSRCATSPAGLAGLRDKDAANVMQVGAQRIPACADSGLDAGGAVDGRAGNVFDEPRSGA